MLNRKKHSDNLHNQYAINDAQARGSLNRREFVRLSGVATLLALLPASLAGCGDNTDAVPMGPAVAWVIGQHANSTHIQNDAVIQSSMRVLNEKGGYLSLTLASSEPVAIGESQFIKPPNNPSTEALAGRYQDRKGPFSALYGIDSAVPAAEEVDYLKSIRRAASTLQTEATDSYSEKRLYIVGSGLSTAGEYINFTKGILNMETESLLDRMVGDDALPDLSGIHVIWYGCGDLAAFPQMEIPARAIKQIKEIWTSVLVLAGAQFDQASGFLDYFSDGSINCVADGFPAVTPIVFTPLDFDDLRLVNMATLPDSIFHFNGNSTEFVKTAETDRILDDYAAALSANGQQVVLLGTTAAGSVDQCRALGMGRALRVQDELISRGVAPENLTALSAGMEGRDVRIGDRVVDFYQPNFDAYGAWDEGIASMNRAVYIIPLELAADVLARFG